MNSRAFVLLAALGLAACAGDAAPSPSAPSTSSSTPPEAEASATASSSAPASPIASSSAAASLSSAPSPSAADDQPQVVVVGSIVEPAISGLRVRSQPGTSAEQLNVLPADAVGLVDLGPLYADGYAWYRFASYHSDTVGADGGWVASGPRSAPWLVETDRRFGDHGTIQGFAGTGSASVGPIEISDPNHGLRWAAVGDDCQLEVVLHHGGESITAVSTSVHGYAEGELPSDFFVANSSFVGGFMIEVASSCNWALSIVVFIG